MKTDDLIKSLSADGATPEMPMGRVWMLALAAAIVLAAVVFSLLLGPRADIDSAMERWRFLFKFVVTILLAVGACMAARSLSMPGRGSRHAAFWVALAPGILAIAAMAEMAILPPGERMQRMIGTNNMLCVLAIPAIGMLPLAVFLAALRHGAPTRPALAGMVAGLLAGGIAATFYAMHCFDDSPLFVAVWYSLAVLVLAGIGAAAGNRVLRW